jgi:hypothetical protein
VDEAGVEDAGTLHAGDPVLCGEKWALNIWLRQRPRRGAGGSEGAGQGKGAGESCTRNGESDDDEEEKEEEEEEEEEGGGQGGGESTNGLADGVSTLSVSR